ncbi:MAG TPA: response regulator transcription factor [Ktedonobacteraceae bacterium]|nr:response regulator transcription factor [Ktedonobacteraceae bacterium]
MTLHMTQPDIGAPCNRAATTSVRISLFSPRELYQVALRSICGEGSGFTLQSVEQTLPCPLDPPALPVPDVIIVDMDILTGERQEAMETILCSLCGIARVIVLADRVDQTCTHIAFASGARGYVYTSVSIETFRQALHVVSLGGLWFEEDVTRLRRQQLDDAGHEAVLRVTRLLSERERQILNRVARGETSKEIAAALYLSESSVRTYWYRVLSKLNALNKAEAITRATRLGLIEADEEEDMLSKTCLRTSGTRKQRRERQNSYGSSYTFTLS